MPSNLRIAVFRGCTFFKIHCLEDGVLSILLLDGKRGGLYLPLTLQSGIFGFLFFLFGGIVGKEVELDCTVVFLRYISLRQEMICNKINKADKQILIHDPVEEF